MLSQLEENAAVQACYAKQWFRYASGRSDKPEDKCSIESISDIFQSNGGNVLGLIHGITQSDSFRYRWANQEEGTDE